MNKNPTLFLFLIFAAFIVGALSAQFIISHPPNIQENQKLIPCQSNYWDFYTPFSDVYIVDVVRNADSSIVHLYPQGEIDFNFKSDGSIKKYFGEHFVECTRTGNGEYIIITDTDIPYLPKTLPTTWGVPNGTENDLATMLEILKQPRDGDCGAQTDTAMSLALDKGLTVRRINLWTPTQPGVLMAEGHTTMEVYNRETKQWIWVDPLYNIIGGRVGNKTLNLHDLYIAVNSKDDIILTKTDGEKIGFSDWEYNKQWRNYLNPSQAISYVPENAYHVI